MLAFSSASSTHGSLFPMVVFDAIDDDYLMMEIPVKQKSGSTVLTLLTSLLLVFILFISFDGTVSGIHSTVHLLALLQLQLRWLQRSCSAGYPATLASTAGWRLASWRWLAAARLWRYGWNWGTTVTFVAVLLLVF
jgi:hypothetical protein